jgi:proline iminopeptidase
MKGLLQLETFEDQINYWIQTKKGWMNMQKKKCTIKTISIFILLLVSTLTFGQKLDSVKCANGYLYFHEYGNGKPIILLAGGPGISCDQIEDVAIELGKSNRAILFEQRGTGRSIPVPLDSTTINLKNAHEDLILLLDHLQLKDAIFLGHSWGSGLSLSFAIKHPDRVKSLILIDTGPLGNLIELRETAAGNRSVRYGQYENAELDRLNSRMKAGTMTEQDSLENRKMSLYCNIYDKENIDLIFSKIVRGKVNYQTYKLLIEDLDRIQFDLSEKLLSFKKPVYAICGRQDPLAFDTYELKILLPSTQVFWIQKSGHFPMYEQPDNFYKILNEILEKDKINNN